VGITQSDPISTVAHPGSRGQGPLTVFINYRHADTQGTAWALFFKLEWHFGTENVFFDNGTLRPGMQWLDEIKSHLSGAAVFLSLIGERWRSSLIAHVKPGDVDYVAKEIDLAFRAGPRVTVIPVLVDDAELPDPSDLPNALKSLPGCHAERLRHTHLAHDIEHLIGRLEEIGSAAGAPAPGPAPATARQGG
jgi:hypothetical protein